MWASSLIAARTSMSRPKCVITDTATWGRLTSASSIQPNLATYPGSNMTEVPGYPYINMIEGDAETHLELLSVNAGFDTGGGTQILCIHHLR